MIISDQAQHQTSVRVCATLLEQLPATRSVVVSKRANVPIGRMKPRVSGKPDV